MQFWLLLALFWINSCRWIWKCYQSVRKKIINFSEFLHICSRSFIWATFIPFFHHVLLSYWSLFFPSHSAALMINQPDFSSYQLILIKVEATTRYASVTENQKTSKTILNVSITFLWCLPWWYQEARNVAVGSAKWKVYTRLIKRGWKKYNMAVISFFSRLFLFLSFSYKVMESAHACSLF